jgi:hypothetical protein
VTKHLKVKALFSHAPPHSGLLRLRARLGLHRRYAIQMG